MCPAWMLHQIAALAGPLGSGGWNVTAAPGGAGNSGGFYLALPKAGRHQQAAFQLASFLTGEQAGRRAVPQPRVTSRPTSRPPPR